MHALIVGEPGVGKSTLIHQVAAALHVPVRGFETRKEDALADDLLGSPIYIYDAGMPRRRTEENLLGYCKERRPLANKAAFDRYAARLRDVSVTDGVILMDEIGTMELCSGDFCQAILSVLDGSTPVIAAVKAKDRPFLNAVRSHPNCRCFFLTQENREELLPDVLAFVRAQLSV